MSSHDFEPYLPSSVCHSWPGSSRTSSSSSGTAFRISRKKLPCQRVRAMFPRRARPPRLTHRQSDHRIGAFCCNKGSATVDVSHCSRSTIAHRSIADVDSALSGLAALFSCTTAADISFNARSVQSQSGLTGSLRPIFDVPTMISSSSSSSLSLVTAVCQLSQSPAETEQTQRKGLCSGCWRFCLQLPKKRFFWRPLHEQNLVVEPLQASGTATSRSLAKDAAHLGLVLLLARGRAHVSKCDGRHPPWL